MDGIVDSSGGRESLGQGHTHLLGHRRSRSGTILAQEYEIVGEFIEVGEAKNKEY